MKKLLNTVYVTTRGTALRKDGETILAEVDGEPPRRVPMHMIGSIVVFGGVYLSPALIGACAETGITIVLLAWSGKFQARIEGPVSGNVLLRRAQYRMAEGETCLEIVRSFVIGKLMNQRAVLKRALRDYADSMMPQDVAAINASVVRLTRLLTNDVNTKDSIDKLRGVEGDAARVYFSVFNHLVRSPDAAFLFKGRSRRPPLDPVNALLSFVYVLLVHDCRSAAECVGLDPSVGFLHRDRPGRPSLALDLMEELRPIMADRLVLSLINRRQIRERDFSYTESGAVTLSDDGRKTVLTAWQDRKRDERMHGFLEEKAEFGLVPYLQAQLLAQHLRGDIDGYPPWIWS